jgi:hypothetical protein
MPCQAQIPQPPARPPPARTLSAWVSTEPRRPVVDEARHSLLRLTVHAGSGRVGFPCVAPFPLASHVPVVVSHPLPGWVAGGGWTVARKVLEMAEPLLPSYSQSYTWESGTKRAVCLQARSNSSTYPAARTHHTGRWESLCSANSTEQAEMALTGESGGRRRALRCVLFLTLPSSFICSQGTSYCLLVVVCYRQSGGKR